MNTEGLRKIAYLIFIILGLLVLCFLLIKYLIPVLIPFLIAWAAAFAVRRPAKRLADWTGMKERVVRPLLTAFFTVLVFFLAGLLVFIISRELWQIISGFGEGEEFRAFVDGFLVSGGLLEEFTGQYGEGLADVIYELATAVLSWLFGILTSVAQALPNAILAIVVTVIAAIYFSIDLERINRAVLSLVPKERRERMLSLKRGFFSVGVKYMLSYFLLFLITFVTVLSGFLILRVPYAFLFALIVSFLDLLPVIGVGTFLIPYGIFEIVRGDTFMGVGLLVLFAVQTLIREIAEPKILGKNLGVHPLLTLLILYVGYALFGFVGILCVPIFTVALELVLAKKNSAEVGGDTLRE